MIIPVGYTDIVEYCTELLFPKHIVLLVKEAVCLLSFRIIFHLVYFSSVKFKTGVSFPPSTPFTYWYFFTLIYSVYGCACIHTGGG